MELLQLKYFKTIGDLENLTKASEALMVSQPSLSNMIKRLEKELGIKLFMRKGRNITLSEEGKILYQYAINITREIDDLEKAIRHYQNKIDEWISIASPNSIFINRWLSDFLLLHAPYKVQHRLLKEEMMVEQLKSGEIDFALMTQRLEDEALESHFLKEDSLVLIVPKAHPFAKKDAIYLSEAKEENFLALSASENYIRLIDDFATKAGFEPNIIFEGETSLLEKVCATGVGFFLHLKSSVDELTDTRIDELRLKDTFSKIKLYLYARKDRALTPACLAFKNFLLNWYHS